MMGEAKSLTPLFYFHPAVVAAYNRLPQRFRPSDLWSELVLTGAVGGEYNVAARGQIKRILKKLRDLGLVSKVHGTWDYTKNYATFESWAKNYLPTYFRKLAREVKPK